MTRDATLKAITKIASNSSNLAKELINIANISSLTPRMFELLHKAQRAIHLNTLEAMVAMVSRYPAQFTGVAQAILKELAVFINDNDMQASALALKVATPTITIANPASNEVQEFIAKSALLSRSPLI